MNGNGAYSDWIFNEYSAIFLSCFWKYKVFCLSSLIFKDFWIISSEFLIEIFCSYDFVLKKIIKKFNILSPKSSSERYFRSYYFLFYSFYKKLHCFFNKSFHPFVLKTDHIIYKSIWYEHRPPFLQKNNVFIYLMKWKYLIKFRVFKFLVYKKILFTIPNF